MLARMGHWLLIVALLGATGGHWAMLQSVAWAKMFAENVKTDSFEEAFTKTFDGKHACAMCRQIANGRNSEKKTDIQAQFPKLEFPPHSTTFVFNTPTGFRLLGDFNATLPSLRQRPPVPPPRSLAA